VTVKTKDSKLGAAPDLLYVAHYVFGWAKLCVIKYTKYFSKS